MKRRRHYFALELPAHESLNTPIASPAIPEKQTARRLGKSWLLVTAVCLLAAAAIGGWFWLRHTPVLDAGARIRAEFWRQLMTPARKTVIVPADTGFVMVQEMSGRTYSLADYESWPGIERYDRVYTDYLKAQKYTSVMDLKLVAQLERLPQAQNGQVDIRSARDLKIEDLSDGNAILLGSIYSNPWIEPFQDRMNFRFIYTPAESRSSIVNLHPLPGEQPSYGSSWNSYSHNTYAVLAFLPNLARTGHVLIIQGLDGAGTEAAANLVLNGDAMRPILEKARRPDGSFRGFEVLIDATSVDSHATSPRILSLRLMD